MASSKARNEAPTNPPAMEPSQDQRLNEKSSTQVQEMSPPHPVVNIPKASGDAAMHLEIQSKDREIKTLQANMAHFSNSCFLSRDKGRKQWFQASGSHQ